ncbi:MAG: peptidoglycan-binding protein [Brasilonema angustatum HA4187-MV1]|jgi:peptidoglycan hydrolase-like protein with peptidoglycan-binding domain|nr:peptidoglycan-binding protein [Brasilonema angustatum HA4187-MV1]
MKSSIKTNPLNDSPFFKPTVNSSGMKTEQRSQALLNVKILLSCGVSLLFGFSTVSIASQPEQIAQTTSSEGINRPTLQIGSKGERVTELQAALKLLGFYTGTVDGEYNESTVVAVSRFQEAAGLKADGIVDTTTWQRLFPGETTVASSGPSPNSSTSRSPLASGTSNTNQVVVPSSNSVAPTPTTTNTPSAASSKPEPTPAGRNTTGTTRTREDNSKTEPRSVTRNTTGTTRTREDNSKTEPRSVTRNTTGGSQTTNVRQSTSTRSGSTRSEQSIRNQQSDRSASTRSDQSSGSRSTTRTQQVASIQYTSEGLPILRIGMRGPEVVKLQRRLQRLGLLNENEVDGDFGQSTEAAVIALQKRNGVEADGVAGGATWDILMKRR